MPMNNLYDIALRKIAKAVAADLGIDGFIREGVYVMLGGPTYETVAELKLLQILGIDAVGKFFYPRTVSRVKDSVILLKRINDLTNGIVLPT